MGVFEEQGGPAPSKGAVSYFCHFQFGVDLCSNSDEISPLFELGNKSPQVHKARHGDALLTLHRFEEFFVRFGVPELIELEFHSGKVFHPVQELSENPHSLQLLITGEKFLTTRT